MICDRCGIGRRDAEGVCDWCAAPVRARYPFWIVFRRWLPHSWLAAEARRGGPIATGVTVGVIVHLLAAAFGVTFRLPFLWQGGFLWSQQWWWVLLPPAWQPWVFAALVGLAYGSLAGLVAGARTARPHPFTPSPLHPFTPSPALVTALVAFVFSGWDDNSGTQYRLIAAGLAAVVGRLTTLIWRSPRGRAWERTPSVSGNR